MKPNDLIMQHEVARNKNIGKNIRIYRECLNLPLSIFADRCHISQDLLESIENGHYSIKKLWMILRIAEELKVGLSDLFETDGEKYYSMFKDKDALKYILLVKKDKSGYSDKELLEKINVNYSSFHNWRTLRHIPHPFVLQNVITLLKVTSEELKMTSADEEKPIASNTEQKEVSNDLDVVIKALNTYKTIPDFVEKLNGIIKSLSELRDALGGGHE